MTRLSAPGYDRFKTVVTIILVIILLLMLLRGCATNSLPSVPQEPPAAAAATVMPPTAAPAIENTPTANPTESPAPTAVPPTVQATGTATEAPATSEVTATATSAPAAEQPTSTPAQTTATSAPDAACQALAAARLSVGQKARVIQRLNVRSAASIKASIIKVNPVNTQVDIIGGPTCEPVGTNAYRWWQISMADGTQGWSAESPLNSSSYFLEPVP